MADLGNIQIGLEVDYRELTGFSKTADQTKRVVRLLAKEFARTGDKSKYMSSINKIVLAQNNLSKVSRLSQSAIMKLGAKVQQETKFTDSLTLATKKLTLAQMASGKAIGNTKNKMNGSNMAIQQMGYQFGDFAVQVQGGTSAFVAFSQQGAQLAGILPMIAGPLGLSMGAAVGLSAALGILIPIGSAVGRMFMEMSGGAKTLEDALKDMDSSLSDFESSMKELDDYNLDSLNGALSEMDTLMSSLAASSAILAEKMTFLDAIQSIKGLNQEVGFWRKNFAGVMTMFDDFGRYVDPLERQAKLLESIKSSDLKGFGFSDDLDVSKYKELITEIKTGLESKDSISVVKSIEDLVNSAMSNGANVTESGAKVLAHFVKIASVQQSITDAKLKGDEDLAKEEIKRLEALAKKTKDLHISVVQNRIDGVDSYYAYEEKIANQKAARGKLVAEINNAKYSTRFAGEESLMGMPLEVDPATQKEIDNQKALNDRRDKSLAKMRLQTQEQLVIQKLKGRELLVAQQFNETYRLQLKLSGLKLKDTDEQYQNEMSILATKHQSILAAYDQGEAEKKLTEEQRKRKKVLAEMEKQQSDLANSIASSMGNALMSMVDGTKSVKDAFKSMASDIIKELYRVLVVEQMVASISGGIKGFMGISTTQANGGAWSGGSQIQAYANGGVVGSPTTFPMTGGKTGLMGEAGPEAIMPLKRGANGKLGVQMEGGGGQGNVVINQSFNFSANGDDSVKKLIAQAAPKIAQMTKSEIINDRRRGGSMKATFG